MSNITLSYILTTYNKLNYLKITLPFLLEACKQDEEIVIVDGGSTDGTADYLKTLFETKKIHQFISEKDAGEAHGTNKAILLAKGGLIKIITDDDVFDFEVIQHCKQFMLNNTSFDIMGFDGLGCKISEKPKFEKSNFIEGFYRWQKDKTPFLFCGLSFLFRKSSVSYMGLLSTDYKIVDMEYSIRVTSLKTKIAFYTGTGFVNIVNPSSNSVKFYEAIRNEQKRLSKIYPSIKINFKLNNPALVIKEKIHKLFKTKGTLPIANEETLLLWYKHIVNESGFILTASKNNSSNKILSS